MARRKKTHARRPAKSRKGKYRRFTIADEGGHKVEHASAGRIPLGESREFAPFSPVKAGSNRGGALAQVRAEIDSMTSAQRTALGVGAVLAGSLALVMAISWFSRPSAPTVVATAPPVA